jgi:hypothetical protein
MINLEAAIVGVICGAVVWPAFLRAPPVLAEWLCRPFGYPNTREKIVALILSYLFGAICVIIFFIQISSIIIPKETAMWTETVNRLRGLIFVFSLVGYALIPILFKIK